MTDIDPMGNFLHVFLITESKNGRGVIIHREDRRNFPLPAEFGVFQKQIFLQIESGIQQIFQREIFRIIRQGNFPVSLLRDAERVIRSANLQYRIEPVVSGQNFYCDGGMTKKMIYAE